MAVNQELIKLHWWLGREIVLRQETEKWGSQAIERFCKDLQSHFPGLKGFSRANVFYMRLFYLTYEIVQRPIGQLEIPPSFCLNIPWGHNISLIQKVKTLQEREWYARATIENGWSRPVLELWIESGLYQRTWILFRGKTSSSACRRGRFLPRPAFLSHQASLLFRH